MMPYPDNMPQSAWQYLWGHDPSPGELELAYLDSIAPPHQECAGCGCVFVSERTDASLRQYCENCIDLWDEPIIWCSEGCTCDRCINQVIDMVEGYE